jgi:hypothetical protein
MIDRPTASWTALLGATLSFLTLPALAEQPILSLGDIESRLTAQGIKIREIEVRDLVVEVEGRDAQGRKVELLVDRRSGEILSQKPDR